MRRNADVRSVVAARPRPSQVRWCVGNTVRLGRFWWCEVAVAAVDGLLVGRLGGSAVGPMVSVLPRWVACFSWVRSRGLVLRTGWRNL